jgi:hypothetical protein
MLNLSLLAQQDNGAGSLFAGLAGIVIVFRVLALLATVFWLWMLIAAITNEPTTNDKILWFLVVFFLHVIGALIYYVVRYRGAGRTAAT